MGVSGNEDVQRDMSDRQLNESGVQNRGQTNLFSLCVDSA